MKDRFIRPPSVELPENSLVPDRNIVSPPPNQFTHVLKRSTPFYLTGIQQGRAPDGELEAGTQVVMMVDNGGAYCRVVDSQGLYAEIAFDALKRIPRARTKR
jgi:hypothetical protein